MFPLHTSTPLFSSSLSLCFWAKDPSHEILFHVDNHQKEPTHLDFLLYPKGSIPKKYGKSNGICQEGGRGVSRVFTDFSKMFF